MKTGLALSGGGARGIAHLGVVKAMLEKGIHFDVISGTSAGAVAGLFLAKGYSPDEALEIFTKTSVYKFLRPAINIRGLFKIGSVESIIKPYFGEAIFTDLDTPFYVSATNVRTGKIRVFS
ncbi:MAG: patatin-like phospholipase family protein, partial [Imperialibacter sp.]